MGKNFRKALAFLSPVLPYGVYESWDDLNPRLYLAIHMYWLKFYGMWYNTCSPKTIKFWLQTTYTIIVFWLVCFLPGIGEVVYLLRRRDNIKDIAEGLYLFLSEMYTYVKVAVFWKNKHKVMKLLRYLDHPSFKPKEHEHEIIYVNSIKTARFVMSSYSSMCVCAVSVGIIMPLTENFAILPTNVEYPYFDVYKSPFYEIIYVSHVYYKPATCIIDGVMDTILAAFIAAAIGQINILAYNLRNFDTIAERRYIRAGKSIMEGKQSKEFYVNSVLKDCIKHHSIIIRYVSMIENAFSLASSLQFMLSVMVLCLVGIQFLSIENPTRHPMQIVWMAVYLTCMLIEVFIICWFGDELILKSQDLTLAAFQGPWLKTDQKNCKLIIILLEKCKRPMRVTAGKTFTLSLGTYTLLINWAYKAFAVISKMKK